MRRERAASIALRAFPAAVRRDRGEEIGGTLLDATATSSTPRFALELAGIVRSGLRFRAAETARRGTARVLADGVCLGAALLLALLLSAELGNRIRGFDPRGPWEPLQPWTLALLAAALLLVVIGRDRLAGGVALAFVACLVADPSRGLHDGGRELMLVVPAACFLVLAAAPRGRAPSLRGLLWLGPVAALAVASGATEDPTAAALVLLLLVAAPAALAALPTDPRLAIACSVPLAMFGIAIAQDPGGPGRLGLLFLVAAPLTLAVAAATTRGAPSRI